MKFSVLQAVYRNDIPEHLDEAIRSVIDQTLPPNELVLVQDGEITPELQAVFGKWKSHLGDKLVHVVNNENQGLARALNIGLIECKYDYIARMDSDDISLPDRFEKQIIFLKDHPDISLLGGWYRQFDETMTREVADRKVPEHNDEIMRYSRIRTPINHTSIIFNKRDVLSVCGYPTYAGYHEDWALVLELSKNKFKCHNLQEYLINVRSSASFYNRRGGLKYAMIEQRTLIELLRRRLISLSDYALNVAIRIPIRFSPRRLRVFLYNIIRKVQ